MKAFYEMLRGVSSSPYHAQVKKFAAPLYDHLAINHFWYYKITHTGDYTYFGSHSAWNEFCFDNGMVSHFPCLRYPENLQRGINLMKTQAHSDVEYKNVLDRAWEKFHINFSINLVSDIPGGVEAFGFATKFNDFDADQRILNVLPMLRQFVKVFKARHRDFFRLLDNYQVNLPNQFGPLFYERPKSLLLPSEREAFIKKLGYGAIFSLTPRELDVLKFVCHGFPASYVAKELQLSKRTVENYMATIKCKLSCSSKVELIEKAKDFVSVLC